MSMVDLVNWYGGERGGFFFWFSLFSFSLFFDIAFDALVYYPCTLVCSCSWVLFIYLFCLLIKKKKLEVC